MRRLIIMMLLSAIPAVSAVSRNETDIIDEGISYVETQNRYGNALYFNGAFGAAMEHYMKARRVAEEKGDSALLAETYYNIGNVYASSESYADAARFFSKALDMTDSLHPGNLRASILNNLTMTGYLLRDFKGAEKSLAEYERTAPRTERYGYDLAINRGLLFQAKGIADSALTSFRRAARLSYAPDIGQCLAAAYSNMADCFEKKGMLDSALFYLKECERIAKVHDIPQLHLETLHRLGRTYDLIGKPELSMVCKSEFLNLSDSMNRNNERSRLRTEETLYDLGTSEAKVQELSVQKRVRGNLLMVTAIAAVICLLFVAVLVRQKRQLKKAWEDIYEKNRQLLASGHPAPNPAAGADGTLADRTRRSIISAEQRDRLSKEIRRIFEETEDFCDCEYSIDKLASSIGSNSRYVSEVINEVFGKNFRALLNEYRVRLAMHRLADSETYGRLTIRAVAESVGYKSQATFISVFTKTTGLKPSIYQKLSEDKTPFPKNC